MNRIEFFNILEKELKKNGVTKIDEILRDHEELFIERMSTGKTEEEIVSGLDNPSVIALTYKDNKNIDVKGDKKNINSKIKFSTAMRLLLVIGLIYCIVEAVRYANVSFILAVPFIVLSVLMLTMCAMLYAKMAKAYGYGTGFAVGLLLLNPIFTIILATKEPIFKN